MSISNLHGYRDILLNMLVKHGVASDIIYVYKKTGLLVTEESVKSMSQEQVLEAKNAAVEYHTLEAIAAGTRH